MKDHDIEPVNYAIPNWNHNAVGIGCKADWRGAKVYAFKRSHVGPVKIIAHSLSDAMHALEALEANAQEKWERENEGIESVQELDM